MKNALFASVALAALSLPAAASAAAYKHVLLVSIDGMHALDLANYVAAHPKGALAELSAHGVTYGSALTPNPSDSFPGTLALTTGGTPYSTGIFYDDSYDREAFKPGSDCKGDAGEEVNFAENIDKDDTKIDGGGTPGDWMSQIDPKNLPTHLKDGKCVPFYPHEFLRVNTLFEVVKAHGGHTAWSDKHPAYELLNGPSGKGLGELYSLEQDSVIGDTKVKTTGSFKAERDFDEARVKALLNMIKGKNGAGTKDSAVPTVFGMNFQAVSVGQKLPASALKDDEGLVGGYADASGAPNSGLAKALDYVDGALGELVDGLKAAKLDGETLIIVTAKHGQSPVDGATLQSLDDDPYTKLPGYSFHIADDASLIWLKPKDREASLAGALDYLHANAKTLGIAAVLTPRALALTFQDPAKDSRTPDFIVNVVPGVVYADAKKKIAEHGGMNWNDRNVALLVSAPGLKAANVPGLVGTTQVAPTILKSLGYDPKELQAVKIEGTESLPGLPF